MFPPSRMAEGSQAISLRLSAWSPRRSRRHDVIPRETSFLLTLASVDTFPVGLCMTLFMNVHLEKTKVFLCVRFPGQLKHDLLVRESEIPFKCWFISPQHHFLHLRAIGVLLHWGQRAGWTNRVWSKKTNLHPDTYVGFIFTHTVSSPCGPPEHQRGLCVLN